MQDRPVVRQSQARPILEPGEPPPLAVHHRGGDSPFLLIGDHGGRLIPKSLENLGVSEADLVRHIAWDIGVAKLGVTLADRLGTTFIHQLYSRLVIDCNRRPGAPDSIPPVSDGTTIPANVALDPAAAADRASVFHAPYQAAIAAELDARAARGRSTILVALHSFTPSMGGVDRPWHVGILHDRGDSRFARAMIEVLGEDGALVVGDNEPYAMDIIDYTVPLHAYPRALPYAEIEIRQDLLADAAGIEQWSERVDAALHAAAARMEELAPNAP